MKEKDFDSHIDDLIIDGLIKEAEQDNADFEAAMRRITDEEFFEIIMETDHAKRRHEEMQSDYLLANTDHYSPVICRMSDEAEEEDNTFDMEESTSRHIEKKRRPTPISNFSKAFPKRSPKAHTRRHFDVSNATEDELRKELPNLEARYRKYIPEFCGASPVTEEARKAGIELALAYMKLHRNEDAMEVLLNLGKH